jgi:hypothetical protein
MVVGVASQDMVASACGVGDFYVRRLSGSAVGAPERKA